MHVYIHGKLLTGFRFDGNSINNGRIEKKKYFTISNVNTGQSKNYMELKDSNFHLISAVIRLIIEVAAWVQSPMREYR
jgi:hypothetical protein